MFKTVLQPITLKNGTKVSESSLIKIMINLEVLYQINVLAFHELVEKCKNSKYYLLKENKQALAALNLIDSNDSIPQSVRNIVLSAVVVYGNNDMTLGSPVALETLIPQLNIKASL